MASVMLGDLNDFIAPGQACVNPLFTAPPAPGAEKPVEDIGGAKVKLMLEDDGVGVVDTMEVKEAKPDLIKSTDKQTAKVSLDDCLACSGCVTSAETVLITQQSTTKLLEAVSSKRYAVIVASISPQARASLAARFGLTPLETQERLLTFLRGIGVGYLIDSSLAVDFSLLEAGEEFVQRYRRVSEEGIGPLWAAPSPTVALSSTRRFNVEAGVEEGVSNGLAQAGNVDGGGGGGGRVAGAAVGSGLAVDGRSRGDGSRGPGELLVITSACPGWVCYAEKTAPEALPCMSTVKSPQQIMGTLAKRIFPQTWGLVPTSKTSSGTASENNNGGTPLTLSTDDTPRGVFHVAIAQCYDKKLEASRKDFRHNENSLSAVGGGGGVGGNEPVQEVDLVLTTMEVMDLIKEHAHAHAADNDGNPAIGTSACRNGSSNLFSSSNSLYVGNTPAVDTPTEDVIPMEEEQQQPLKTTLVDNTPPGNTPQLGTPKLDVPGVFLRSHPATDLAHPLGPGFPVGQAAISTDGLSLFGGVDGEGAAGGDSGGYLEYVFRYAAFRLFGREDLTGQPLVYREGRNSDFRETSLEVDGKVVLRFAYAYGFRNIQSILAKSRRGKCPYHFVEVMACPSGCLNGGGQIKPKKEGPRDTRQRVEMVAGVLHKDLLPRAPQDNPLVQAMYRELLGGEPGAPAARPFFHTTYHNVPKLEESNPHMSPW